MSHYTCLVITNPGQNPEDLLAPYSENLEVEEYQDMNIEIAKKEKFERTAELKSIIELSEEEQEKQKYDMVRVNKMYSDIISQTDEEYLGSCLYGEEEKERGYSVTTYNPKSKWDWYALGGRWTGNFVLKKGRKGKVGNPGLMTPPADDGSVDAAKVSDIDWEAFKEKRRFDAEKKWEKYVNEPEERRWFWDVREGITKDEFVEEDSSWRLFSFITPDGEWHEKASMGWFGVTSDERDEEYQKEWDDMFSSLQNDQTLWVFDLHI